MVRSYYCLNQKNIRVGEKINKKKRKKKETNKKQKQNRKVPKHVFYHDFPVMCTFSKLHWLPVKYRIMYKILLTYKSIHEVAPIYL